MFKNFGIRGKVVNSLLLPDNILIFQKDAYLSKEL